MKQRNMSFLGCCLTAALAQSVRADIQVEVTAAPDPVRPGESIDLEITVTNDGPFDRTDVDVLLAFPAHLATMWAGLIDGTCPGGFCDTGEDVTFNIPVLSAGEGITFSLPPRVAGGTADGTVVSFDVDVVDDGSIAASASTTATVDSGREIELALVENQDPAPPGGEIIYKLTYGVLASSAGSPLATLSLPLPAGATFVSASDGGVLDGGTVEWSLGSLGPGSTGERSVTLQVSSGMDPGSILIATATYEDMAGPANAVSYASATRVQNDVPLELTVVASPDPVRPGETIDLELTVTNTGFFDRTGVVLRMETPDHLSSLWQGLFDGTCPGGFCDAQERAVFDIGTIPAGQGVTFSLPPRVVAATADGTVLTFEAEVHDSTGDRRESGASVAVKNAREVELALQENLDPAVPGDLITYTVTYGLIDSSFGAPGAMLKLPVPDGTTFVSASDGGDLSGGAVQWSVGSLNPGATGERVVTFQVDAGTDSGDVIFAEAFLEDASTPKKQVSYETSTRVQSSPPLQLDIIASPDPARPGETLDLEVTVSNTSAFDRTGVVVNMETPDHLSSVWQGLFDGTCPGGFCDPQERATFSIGTIAAGGSITFSAPPRVAAGTVTGTVMSFEADVRDSSGERRESGTSIGVNSTRKLDLALRDSDDPVGPGSSITYTITYGTSGTGGGSSGATLQLRMPRGTSFVVASDGGTASGDLVEWSLGSLNPGAGGERYVTVEVDAGLPSGAILQAEAQMNDAASAANEVRFEESTRLASEAPLDVELTVTPKPASAGATLDADVSITNNSPFERTDVVIHVEFPDDIASLWQGAFEGGTCPGGFCDPQERASFAVGTLAAGETISFEMPPVVTAGSATGTVINFDAWGKDSTGLVSGDGDAIMIGASFDPAGEGDVDGDGVVSFTDLIFVISKWGPCEDPDACPEDFDGNGVVALTDLLEVLANWGG